MQNPNNALELPLCPAIEIKMGVCGATVFGLPATLEPCRFGAFCAPGTYFEGAE
jgi:hypothetical protein